MQLTRRSTLLGGASLAVAGALFGTFLTNPDAFIKAALRDHFAPLRLSESDLNRFVADFRTSRPQWNALKHRVFGRLGAVGLMLVDQVDGPERLRREALTAFILGSDAMLRTDPNEPISYINFPEPYEVGCIPGYPLA